MALEEGVTLKMSEQLWKDRALAAEAQAERLVREARRFYREDGTFEELDSPEVVVERRIAAARELRDEKATREHVEAQMVEVADALRDGFKPEEIANLTLLGVAMKARDGLAELALVGEIIRAATPKDAPPALSDRLHLVFDTMIQMHQALEKACCSYCGHVIERTEVGAAAKAHMEVCEKHPLHQARAELEEYRMRLAGVLTVLEGNPLDLSDERLAPYLRTCPTLAAAVRVMRSAPDGQRESADDAAPVSPACPMYPDEAMAACGDAVLGRKPAGPGDEKVCEDAEKCHAELVKVSPALVQLALEGAADRARAKAQSAACAEVPKAQCVGTSCPSCPAKLPALADALSEVPSNAFAKGAPLTGCAQHPDGHTCGPECALTAVQGGP